MTGLDSVRRTAISPGCPKGRSFASELLAEKAIGKGAEGIPEECARGGIAHWHLHVPGNSTGPDAKTRALVLGRDGYACVCCGVSVIGRRYSLGHRLRASQLGKATPSNLLTFLGWGGELCHGRIDFRRDPEDEAKGYTVRSGQDPALIPVMVFSPGGSGATVWLDDLGSYLTEAPEGAEAA